MVSRVADILENTKRLHFVGIGGSGMFPLVEILRGDGFEITGSDVNEGSITKRERELGIPVSIGHDAANVDGAGALVVSAALLDGNPEVGRARELGLPVIERAELLGFVTSRYSRAMCVSGTHGKTTASSMLTSIFLLAGRDPAAVIGGRLPLIGGYGRGGRSDYMVCEACEFKDTFLELEPYYSVILNIDADHLDYFGTVDRLKASFSRFAALAKKAVVAFGDDPNTVETLRDAGVPVVWFGEGENCRFRISDISDGGGALYGFSLSDGGAPAGRYRLSVPGRHNVFNAAAAAVCALLEGISPAAIQRGFDSFTGAGRRFEILGRFGGVTIADDYAHHPAELEATLAAAAGMGFGRIVAVFQPFTFSRTKMLLDDFARALSAADLVVLSEIMGSREVNTFGISSADLADKIPGAVCIKSFEDIADYCLASAKSGDLIITLGCGDIYKAAHLLVEKCKL
jgi:UDP-N-acetylmuramate--alanine ligase